MGINYAPGTVIGTWGHREDKTAAFVEMNVLVGKRDNR